MPETPMSIDERIARQLVDDDDRISKLMAESWSPPPNAAPVSEARELELWLQADPTFDERAAWAQHAAQGTDPWVARTDIALRKYPNRKKLMETGRPKVKEQILYANAMAAKAARKRAVDEADAITGAPEGLGPYPATPGPVPIPMPRAAPMAAEPAVPAPMPSMPTEPMQRISGTAVPPPPAEPPY
jgi:hypothetical protein